MIETNTKYIIEVLPFKESTQINPINDLNNSYDESYHLFVALEDIAISRDSNSFDSSFDFNLQRRKEYNLKPSDWILVYKTVSSFYNPTKDIELVSETIKFEDNYEKYELKVVKYFLGQIDRVEDSLFTDEKGVLSDKIYVAGKGFARIFPETRIFLNPFVEGVGLKDTFITSTFETNVPVSMRQAILKFMSVYMSTQQKIVHENMQKKFFVYNNNPKDKKTAKTITKAPSFNGKTIYDLLKIIIDVDDERFKTLFQIAKLKNGTVGDFINSYKEPMINELICDLFPVTEKSNENKKKTQMTPCFKIHEFPFTIKKEWEGGIDFGKKSTDRRRNYFENLPVYEIDWKDGLIYDFRMGKSGHELFNFFMITSELNPIQDWLQKITGLQVNEQSYQVTLNKIARFGLKIKEESTIYDGEADKKDRQPALTVNNSQIAIQVLDELVRLLRHWFIDMDTKYSGTIKGVFPNYICLGSMIRIKNVPFRTDNYTTLKTFEGYITGVNDTWTLNNPETILKVTYGRYVNNSDIKLGNSNGFFGDTPTLLDSVKKNKQTLLSKDLNFT